MTSKSDILLATALAVLPLNYILKRGIVIRSFKSKSTRNIPSLALILPKFGNVTGLSWVQASALLLSGVEEAPDFWERGHQRLMRCDLLVILGGKRKRGSAEPLFTALEIYSKR